VPAAFRARIAAEVATSHWLAEQGRRCLRRDYDGTVDVVVVGG
jgi:hypothetical protein